MFVQFVLSETTPFDIATDYRCLLYCRSPPRLLSDPINLKGERIMKTITIGTDDNNLSIELQKEIYAVLNESRRKEERLCHEQRRHWCKEPFDENSTALQIPNQYQPTPEEQFYQKEALRFIMETLATCTPVQRERFLLFALDGMSFAKIAKLHGCSKYFSIHDPKGEQRNVHAHILLTLRALTENGEWASKCRKEYDLDERGQRIPDGKGGWKNPRVNLTDWNDLGKAEEWRAAWAALVNQTLERNGIHERVDHRSYKRQGVERIPTIHMGVAATQMEKRGIRTDKGNVNREIAAQNRLLKEIKARLTRLHQWTKELKERQEVQPSIQILLEQAQADIQSKHSATHYGKARALKEHAALVAFLQENQIASLDELHAKVKAMQSDYYDLRGEIVADERAIAALQERLTMWAQYNDNREHAKTCTEHSTEKALYEAAARYLADLKDNGERITPKRWNAELTRLTAHKEALYGQMKGMQAEIQAAERIRKAADKLAREAKPPLNREEML